MRILVVDVGGTHVKLRASGQRTILRLDSGPTLTPADMVAAVRAATQSWQFDAVSVGYPGPVIEGQPTAEPVNLGPGWVGFDFAAAFDRPTQVINDAAMQALGGYRGGRMLFLGLGTGLGTALVVEGHIQPLELAHLPYRKRTFEHYVGEAGRRRVSKDRWRRRVVDVVDRLMHAMQVQSLLLGGGNARRMSPWLDRLPEGTRIGSNMDAIRGGLRLWRRPENRARPQPAEPTPPEPGTPESAST
jgi:polyphosphate glucokinase